MITSVLRDGGGRVFGSICHVMLLKSQKQKWSGWFPAALLVLCFDLTFAGDISVSGAMAGPDADGNRRNAPSDADSARFELSSPLGIAPAAIQGVDSRGIAEVCGTVASEQPNLRAAPSAVTVAETRSWELIPGVVRDDGQDEFRIEVSANGPVKLVTMPVPATLVSASGSRQIFFKDDGQGYDRKANDFVFTSEPLRFNTNGPISRPYFYMRDTNSPQGLAYLDMDDLTIVETNDAVSSFLIIPRVGILAQEIPATGILSGGANVQLSPHLINVQTSNSVSQFALRGGAVCRI